MIEFCSPRESDFKLMEAELLAQTQQDNNFYRGENEYDSEGYLSGKL